MDNVVERAPSPVARWVAALLCFTYGFAKINGSQFTVLDSELARPMGEVTGFWLTWHYFGFSPVYGTFLALVQIVSGVLLLVPRTALLGAVVLLPIAVNILLVDIFYGVDIGGMLAALVLLVCVSMIAAPFASRLRAAAVLDTLPRRPSRGSLVGLALAVPAAFAFTWWVANFNNRAPTPIDGVWVVATPAGDAVTDSHWKRVFFERNRAHLVVFRRGAGRDERHHFEVDSTGVVRVWRDWLRKGPLIMQGRLLSETEIELTFPESPSRDTLLLRRIERAP
jgi:hypothetical protein